MTQPHFSVSWNEHLRNITTGLSTLQQNSEFVDMTLAADGHFVKVHKVLMALSSPYIKDLISSAQCKHPIIFLNKISYTTLTAILEYVYTGEVLVGVEDLKNVIDAAQELHIKGLQDMDLTQLLTAGSQKKQNELLPQAVHMDILDAPTTKNVDAPEKNILKHEIEEIQDDQHLDETMEVLTDTEDRIFTKTNSQATGNEKELLPSKNSEGSSLSTLQYTVSNQGSLQMILNRFVYYLKHTNRDRTRQWRCVDYINSHHCPAYVVTKGDVIVQRILAHTHPFHDKRILKKLKNGTIFSAIQEAENEGINKKNRLSENK